MRILQVKCVGFRSFLTKKNHVLSNKMFRCTARCFGVKCQYQYLAHCRILFGVGSAYTITLAKRSWLTAVRRIGASATSRGLTTMKTTLTKCSIALRANGGRIKPINVLMNIALIGFKKMTFVMIPMLLVSMLSIVALIVAHGPMTDLSCQNIVLTVGWRWKGNNEQILIYTYIRQTTRCTVAVIWKKLDMCVKQMD